MLVKAANVLTKLARLSFHGDQDAHGFVPMEQGSSGPLPEVLNLPIWHQQLSNKKYGKFNYTGGPFMIFRWKLLWAQLQAQKPVFEFTFDEPDEFHVQSDGRLAPQPWVASTGFEVCFTGLGRLLTFTCIVYIYIRLKLFNKQYIYMYIYLSMYMYLMYIASAAASKIATSKTKHPT